MKEKLILDTFAEIFGRTRTENVLAYLKSIDFFNFDLRTGDSWHYGDLANFMYFCGIADEDGTEESIQLGFKESTGKLVQAIASRLARVNPDGKIETHLKNLHRVKIGIDLVVFEYENQSIFFGEPGGSTSSQVYAMKFNEIFLMQF